MSFFWVHPAFQDNLDVLRGVHVTMIERHFGEYVKAMLGLAVSVHQKLHSSPSFHWVKCLQQKPDREPLPQHSVTSSSKIHCWLVRYSLSPSLGRWHEAVQEICHFNRNYRSIVLSMFSVELVEISSDTFEVSCKFWARHQLQVCCFSVLSHWAKLLFCWETWCSCAHTTKLIVKLWSIR